MNQLVQGLAALAVKNDGFRAELEFAASRPVTRRSKYATKPFVGNVRLSEHSSLKKLMRAARRGMLYPTVLDRIHLAQKVASDRADVYKSKRSSHTPFD